MKFRIWRGGRTYRMRREREPQPTSNEQDHDGDTRLASDLEDEARQDEALEPLVGRLAETHLAKQKTREGIVNLISLDLS